VWRARRRIDVRMLPGDHTVTAHPPDRVEVDRRPGAADAGSGET
jgi:hypothetical protein